MPIYYSCPSWLRGKYIIVLTLNSPVKKFFKIAGQEVAQDGLVCFTGGPALGTLTAFDLFLEMPGRGGIPDLSEGEIDIS